MTVLGIPAIVWAFQMQQSNKISTSTEAQAKLRQILSLKADAEVFHPYKCSIESLQQTVYILSLT